MQMTDHAMMLPQDSDTETESEVGHMRNLEMSATEQSAKPQAQRTI